MRYAIAKREDNQKALSAERALLQAALARLDEVRIGASPTRAPGRLIFGLDLTGSREASLAQARMATAAMFDALKAVGKLAVKLAYYRGMGECQTSSWHDDPDVLCRSMLGLSCESGVTQIVRLLRMALTEKNVSAVVFIGDHCEDDRRRVEDVARELGQSSIPVFVFHERADHDKRSLKAKPLFKRVAELSKGAYVEFKPDSSAVLREMLSSVGAFSVAGIKGIEVLPAMTTPEGRQLRKRLLLGTGNTAR